MAVAINAPAISDKAASQTRAAAWTGISAGIALIATIPMLMVLEGPVRSLVFVRGSVHNGDWSHLSTVLAVLLAPATYAMFFGTTGELLKTRVNKQVHKVTMRVAAVGMLPYIALVMLGVSWQGGPQQSLVISAALTLPIAMIATVWASTQNH